MLEEAIFHKPETEYCYAKSQNRVALRIRVAKKDRPEISIIYGCKYDFFQNHFEAQMSLSFTDNLFNYYTVELNLKDVRLVYVFQIKEGDKIYYFSEDGLTQDYDFSLNHYNAFQFAYINSADVHRRVEWLKNARFYQIFVDRFERGNYFKKDGYINLSWGEIPEPTSFAGGDLLGVAHRLDYLINLGINALYLTPVFKSKSNHKYDIIDYFSIDEHFGGERDLAYLINKAHEKGVKVVLDAVFNHASSDCKEFKDVIEKGKKSLYYDWFIINGDCVDTQNPNYECFSSLGYMPKWNTSNPEVQKFLIDIGLYWIEKYDIDGWRLDVSDEVSHEFWKKFRLAVKEVKPDCAIIGENWHDANPYLRGDEYDGIMNYAFTKACLDFFVYKKVNAQGFAEKLNSLLMRNTDTVNSMMLNLLDSHDTHRFITLANGDISALEGALSVLYFYSGAPCIYYGTEIALEGGYDPDCRRTMNWKKAEENSELKRIICSLAHLKKNRKELCSDGIRIYAKGDLLVIERGEKGEILRLIVNGGDNQISLNNKCVNTQLKANSAFSASELRGFADICAEAHAFVNKFGFWIEKGEAYE